MRYDFETYRTSQHCEWEQSTHGSDQFFGIGALTGTSMSFALNFTYQSGKFVVLEPAKLFFDSQPIMPSYYHKEKTWLKGFPMTALSYHIMNSPSLVPFYNQIKDCRELHFPTTMLFDSVADYRESKKDQNADDSVDEQAELNQNTQNVLDSKQEQDEEKLPPMNSESTYRIPLLQHNLFDGLMQISQPLKLFDLKLPVIDVEPMLQEFKRKMMADIHILPISTEDKLSTDFEKIWIKTNGSSYDKAKALLLDYTKNNSRFFRVLTLHWNRHHIEDVANILAPSDTATADEDKVKKLLDGLNKIKLKNTAGKLGECINYIAHKTAM